MTVGCRNRVIWSEQLPCLSISSSISQSVRGGCPGCTSLVNGGGPTVMSLMSALRTWILPRNNHQADSYRRSNPDHPDHSHSNIVALSSAAETGRGSIARNRPRINRSKMLRLQILWGWSDVVQRLELSVHMCTRRLKQVLRWRMKR